MLPSRRCCTEGICYEFLWASLHGNATLMVSKTWEQWLGTCPTPLAEPMPRRPAAATANAQQHGAHPHPPFLITVMTTLVQACWAGSRPLKHPELLYRGIPFAGTLLAILFCHEMGYLRDGHAIMVWTSPCPILSWALLSLWASLLGTFGAVIRMKSPHSTGVPCCTLSRRAYCRVCVALPAMIYAFATATQVPMLLRVWIAPIC
jgi:hypothetical protein